MEENQNLQKKVELINPEDVIAEHSLQDKPLWKRIWFWLTCLRPITKYESVKLTQAWLRMSVATVNNYRMIEGIVHNLNQIIMVMRQEGKFQESQTAPQSEDKENKNDDVMYN